MIGLIACESSGRVKQAFRDKGHEFWSCDIKPSEIQNDKFHIQDDIRNVLKSVWVKRLDFLGAHPDCSKLANSGVRWLFEKEGRWEELKQAADFFNIFVGYDVSKKYIENPIPHKYAKELIGDYTQLIQPHWFIGSNLSKATCLWLTNLPKLYRTQWLDKKQRKQSVWLEPPGDNQKTNRARTDLAVATAMAQQWG